MNFCSIAAGNESRYLKTGEDIRLIYPTEMGRQTDEVTTNSSSIRAFFFSECPSEI